MGNVIHMHRTAIFLDVHEQIFLCKMSGSSLLLKLFTNPLQFRSEPLYLILIKVASKYRNKTIL